MRLAALLDVTPTAADALVTRLLRDAESEIVPINEDVAHGAVAAFERYGNGRKNHAGLNFGDCLSYACARTHDAKLLFKGTGFTQNDIVSA